MQATEMLANANKRNQCYKATKSVDKRTLNEVQETVRNFEGQVTSNHGHTLLSQKTLYLACAHSREGQITVLYEGSIYGKYSFIYHNMAWKASTQ